ncbi:MAG: metalloregulator ArsR/SmtB family transcription factor [Acidobacteriia bacterium]|nr:metalloregulator ArsR/SmtB family transcription factor [Terriglobia bacterium]
MENIETYFKGLADLSRLRIINLLQAGELCGCDIQYVLEAPQSNVSRHLTYLKRCGLVQDRREGYRVYYRLFEQDSPEYKALIAYLKGALNDRLFVADRKRLARAVKEGACSVSELKPAVALTKLEFHSRVRR